MTKLAPTVQLVNLGCAKNVVDSEEMLGELARDGFAIDAQSKQADVVVLNTCAFIESAREESVNAILEALERKKRGEVGRVIVAGCLAQRYAKELAGELTDVDAFLGTGMPGEISRVARKAMERPGQNGFIPLKPLKARNGAQVKDKFIPLQPFVEVEEKPHHRWLDVPSRIRSTAPWTAYLKISEGCDHTCTFCAIPSFRGKHVSKPFEKIVAEAQMLAEQGAKELCLIAQDSTQYGYDLYGKPRLPELLEALSEIEGVQWLRLFYCYPSRVNQRLIDAIAHTPKVCHYIDMPLQHADDQVLRAMRRPMSGQAYLDLVSRFREAAPDAALRTTFIVGFPGETDAQFENLLEFVRQARFDRVGVFEYSVEEGTPSGDMPNRVPARIKRQRKDRLMQTQQSISLDRNRSWIGRELDVLVESIGSGSTNTTAPTATGRSFRDAPEIDGLVHLTGQPPSLGQFVRARITGADTYDLFAEIV